MNDPVSKNAKYFDESTMSIPTASKALYNKVLFTWAYYVDGNIELQLVLLLHALNALPLGSSNNLSAVEVSACRACPVKVANRFYET